MVQETRKETTDRDNPMAIKGCVKLTILDLAVKILFLI